VYKEIKTTKQIHTTHNIQKRFLKYFISLCIGSVGSGVFLALGVSNNNTK
jgi:hypothetical protein